MSNGSPWPRITIVTPSFNQGQFIEETLRSVLLQGYPNLEYLVLDGGSTDNSVEVIKKYGRWLTYWACEPDNGQAAAINKGFRRATGQILQWINSDDLLAHGALAEVARLAVTHPTALIAGGCENFWPDGRKSITQNRGLSRETVITLWRHDVTYQQSSVFVPANAVRSCDLLIESRRYCFDMEWMIRLLKNHPVTYTAKILSLFRWHPHSKSFAEREAFTAELGQVSEHYWNEIGDEQVSREYALFLQRDAWLAILDRTLASNARKSAKLWTIFIKACQVPIRLARRETWGTIRRIVL